MHRILSLLLAAALLLACTPVLAQHPVITASGQVDETQAVDILVDYLCIILRCGEEEVRGRWHYTAAYAPEGDSLDIHEGPVWDLEAGLPGGGEGIAFAHIYVDARCGLILEWCENPGCDLIGPEGWGEMCPIPRKDQMQPSEAVARAAGLLEDIADLPDELAMNALMSVCGIGKKVASCILLYGLAALVYYFTLGIVALWRMPTMAFLYAVFYNRVVYWREPAEPKQTEL